jgi:hypothetical protein
MTTSKAQQNIPRYKNMKIDFTKKQYRDLVTLISTSNGIFGILGDSLQDTDYKKRSCNMDELEEHVLRCAHDFGCDDVVEQDSDTVHLDDKYYEEKIMPIIEDFEEYALHDNLSTVLAKRDFRQDHSRKEIEKMAEERGGYLGVPLYDYEKKYWDEFEAHGFDRLEINEDVKGDKK